MRSEVKFASARPHRYPSDMVEGEAPCAVTFKTFAIPVVVGNLAAIGVGAITRTLYKSDAQTTRETATAFTRWSAFWLAAGLTWIALNRRNGAAT